MAEPLRSRFGNLVEAFGCLWVATYLLQVGPRRRFRVSAESIRHDLFLTGPNWANAGVPSQQGIKAARVRLGSTHSYRRIRPASESADWPVDREASGRLCHLMKRGAFPGWQKLLVPACPLQVGANAFLPSSPCCDCQHYALHATQPCESCSRPARGFVYKKRVAQRRRARRDA